MRRRLPRAAVIATTAALAVVASGCAVTHTPVPVLAEPGTPDLGGVWEGTYESRETGRVGDVYLALSADADSAQGEVVMVPRGGTVSVTPSDGRPGATRWRWEGVARAQVLTIRFVHLMGGEVVGELDPYRDPDCGCLLRTTFRGEVEGDAVHGTFATEAEEPYHDAEGTWHAVRRADPDR